MLKASWLRHKNVLLRNLSYLILAKNALTSKSDFGKPQNRETFRYLSNLKVSAVIFE